ncbi:MAG: sugar phosphate isomerase/epimerase family protein [FCB group bacterium]|jgi:sugar phosphate isomerase/epimerase|nr:sugar phosphate isomerase/epimerase family protein [FCB group bacterium]
MKFGICNEIFKDWNDIERTIEYVKSIGYDGLEIAPFTLAQYVTDIDNATRRKIVRTANEAGLDILGIHWVLVGPDGMHITNPDSAVRDRTVQYIKDLANFCGDVGGRVMIFGSPKQRNIMEGVSPETAFGYAADCFSRAMDVCQDRGVTICMEQLSPKETNFCSTVEETVRLIEAVNHRNFQLLLDTKAMEMEEKDRGTLIRECAQYLKHYHANDPNLNGPGWGDVDFAPIFEALKDIDYDRYVSVEVFKFEPGPEAIATKSLEYMQRFV